MKIKEIIMREYIIDSSILVISIFLNKIVQRFYETRLCRSVWRKAKIPIPAASCYETGFVNSCFICSLKFIFAHRIIEH
jgi:hypothetical protein